MYKRKQKIWRGNTTHNEKHHNRCIKSLRQQVKCPFCKKRYSSLESLLIDAKLKELKSTWIQCECPQKPQQITDKETWIYITQENEKRNTEQNGETKGKRKSHKKTMYHKKTTKRTRKRRKPKKRKNKENICTNGTTHESTNTKNNKTN